MLDECRGRARNEDECGDIHKSRVFFWFFSFFFIFFFLVVWLSLAEMKLYLEPPAPLKINKC